MIKSGRTTTIRMTTKTCIAVIGISAYTLMLVVHIILNVALKAAEYSVITGIRMTVAAGIPFPVMLS